MVLVLEGGTRGSRCVSLRHKDTTFRSQSICLRAFRNRFCSILSLAFPLSPGVFESRCSERNPSRMLRTCSQSTFFSISTAVTACSCMCAIAPAAAIRRRSASWAFKSRPYRNLLGVLGCTHSHKLPQLRVEQNKNVGQKSRPTACPRPRASCQHDT